jgi:hypothetical protein
MRPISRLLAFLTLVGLLGTVHAQVWHWRWGHEFNYLSTIDGVSYLLTRNSGAHAVDMTEYNDNGTKTWITVLAESVYNADPSERNVRAFEYSDLSRNVWDNKFNSPVGLGRAGNQRRQSWGQVELNPTQKFYSVVVDQDDQQGPPFWPAQATFYAHDGLPDQDPAYNRTTDDADRTPDSMSAIGLFRNSDYACIVYTVEEHDAGNPFRLEYKSSTNGGYSWTQRETVVGSTVQLRATHPSLVVDDNQGSEMLLAFDYNYDGNGTTDPRAGIYVLKSNDHGDYWPRLQPGTAPRVTGLTPSEPCLAVYERFVFLCWAEGNAIKYQYSSDFGGSWSSTATVPFVQGGDNPVDIRFDSPNAAVVNCNDYPHSRFGIMLAARAKFGPPPSPTSARGMFGLYWGNGGTTGIVWRNEPSMCSKSVLSAGDPVNPNVAALNYTGDHGGAVPHAVYVRSVQEGYPTVWGRSIVRRSAFWTDAEEHTLGGNTARRLTVGDDGAVHFAWDEGPCYEAGEVIEQYPWYDVAGMGCGSALAVDEDNQRWVAFICGDTVYCQMPGELAPLAVFCGSSSAVPSQPSIVCYPNQANGVYVGNVVFPVYDTAGGSSVVMYARVDTTGVVLDTIESTNTLRDSLPCINIYLSDSLVVTYQHGDSIVSRLLPDYGPATQGQPPAWSSLNLVTASGFHPMSVMENGSVVNCAYTQQSSGYSIQRATNNLGGGLFGNWVAMTPPGATSNVDKDAAAYAGAGASVWQQKVNGKWAIKAFVRGAETTLVANDTDAYSPHAVAESSASSPSVDRIRIHLLYTAGVAFEVDSAVFDTGQIRYSTFDFDVSNAGPDATRANNGSKLMRTEDDDSLHAVYQDADGTVMYAYSAAGDSWRREVLATSRCYPAIAADSTGKRWVVAMSAFGSLPAAQYLYYQSGGSWASQTLYSGWDILGPASLAGASSTTTGIAYTAFKVMGMSSQYIVLTKFNGTTVAACTVATGANFGDPSIAVEAYKTDSDHVHVTWEDAGVVKYRMNTDGRSSGIANKWTSVVTLSDAQATSHHPSINCDRDQIVAAWAQGATAEIYYRERSTASAYNNWDAAANLSNTANDASDWPTIAMGDTVVVAWEETRAGGTDHDILACINFGDTLNVADNATVSGYPHVIFQNKASGDTAIPYLHCVWSETPSESYYEVAYNKLNLKQSSGEGQQSASSVPIPTKPTLTSCSPNPFRDRTQIRYALPTDGNVNLRVYDAAGRTVRTLASGHQRAGSYSVTWDSRDNRGREVPRGVYFYRLDTPGFRSVKKAVVTR